ncbi:MAG: chemotaxis protein CheD [Thermoanaerobaculia bacterium]|jgi:chemotaxis protein CheD
MSSIDALLAASNLQRERPQPSGSGLQTLYLHAGQLHASSYPTEITTVLGSCVAICVWDAAAQVGGMNHFMLPFEVSGPGSTPRYATFATRELVERVEAAGGSRSRFEARVFGGGTMLAGVTGSNDLGLRNAAAAFEILEEMKIVVVEHSVRGNHGRRVVFRTDTGEASVRRIG